MIKRKVFKKQARKAIADHLIKCSMMPGRRRMKSNALAELFVNGKFTEDREKWQHEFRRHCEGETKEVQEGRIENFFCKGNLHFTVEGRRAEIIIDVVLQASKDVRKQGQWT